MDLECPTCRENGKKSKLEYICVDSQCMDIREFVDDNGKYHLHDPNPKAYSFNCKEGHQFIIDSYKRRCWCGE
jgi:hypothetical protein